MLTVVEVRAWPSRSETTGTGIPAASMVVAMKCRRSCSRNAARPARRRYVMKRFVTQFGCHGLVPATSSLKTNAAAEAPTRSLARSRRPASSSTVVGSNATR
jgi:hypothetical protein